MTFEDDVDEEEVDPEEDEIGMISIPGRLSNPNLAKGLPESLPWLGVVGVEGGIMPPLPPPLPPLTGVMLSAVFSER